MGLSASLARYSFGGAGRAGSGAGAGGGGAGAATGGGGAGAGAGAGGGGGAGATGAGAGAGLTVATGRFAQPASRTSATVIEASTGRTGILRTIGPPTQAVVRGSIVRDRTRPDSCPQ